MNELLQNISENLQKGKMPEVVSLTKQAVSEGLDPSEILNGLLDGMGVIGEKFKKNEVFVPEVLIAARAMNGGLDVIKPLLEEQGVDPVGKVIIGTVKGDLHDIGKNLVRMMMVGAGLDVIDLGVDVSPEKYIAAVEENNPDIVAMSALLTTTMPNMKLVIDALEEKGLRDKVKVMIGGAPVTDNYAQEIGADRYTSDAATAAEVAKELILN
ncbi:corrinoid methyltransferase [Vallitalea longa]|uniref:Corrinoid methyltransferase n=1 Tax=Vallitalea longa TaxID=2936439 RepID=A0A9W5Y7A5_9FIRM|nr:corrinoid protein [Vallitalea longa]GKX27970.1 corrinoid methyltransferase [Vallitalea longa]